MVNRILIDKIMNKVYIRLIISLVAIFSFIFSIIIVCSMNEKNNEEKQQSGQAKEYNLTEGTIIPAGIIKTEQGKSFLNVYKINYEGKTYTYFEKSNKPVMVIP